MATVAEALKRCPFCLAEGGPEHFEFSDGATGYYAATCDTCGTEWSIRVAPVLIVAYLPDGGMVSYLPDGTPVT